MTTTVRIALLCGFSALLLMASPGWPQTLFDLPQVLPPDEYGNLIISRSSNVVFSHWMHRQKFTCRVCHFELEFNMLVNTTEITEAANKSGRYCGARGCHDGKASFGHEEPHCGKCHTSNLGQGKEKFSTLSKFPKAKYGNGIDWVQAYARGLIKPVHSLTIKPPSDIAIIKPLLLEAEWNDIPPAIFSHKVHTQWLDCNNCHPDIFNIKKKTTKHFSMNRILKREFCGVCHLTVAFPMNDCKRCHSSQSSLQE